MWQSLLHSLGAMQGEIVRSLSAALRAGDGGIVLLAVTLGALHALTPGHGKAALTAYFLGREASAAKGVRVAMTAALLHVLSGFAAFLVLRFVLQQVPSMTARGSPAFTALGYVLIVVAGLVIVFQSLRPAHAHLDGSHALTAGIGLLPCPLTISVLGFAWAQGTAVTIALALISLALGIALTIGGVAMLAIALRQLFGRALAAWMTKINRGARILQGVAGVFIASLGLWMIWAVR